MAAAETDLHAVITQPDRPAGRGYHLTPTPVKHAARALGLRTYEPARLQELQADALAGCEVLIVASYGKILPQRILDLAARGALNVHPSLLPKYRGATPIQAALRNGDTETGVSIMQMDAGMDTGPIFLQQPTAIGPAETYGELHDRLAALGADLLAHVLRGLSSGAAQAHPQLGAPSTTRPLRRDDLALAWDQTPADILNLVRAYAPVPAARAMVAGVRLKVLRAAPYAGDAAGLAPGTVIGLHDDALVVACRGGGVMLQSVVPPNKGAMSGAAFARSTRLLP
ncbi:MAG: methionyl-tRNA formyltransferase [Vulcanimicrobiaceae bacterium]